MRSSWPLRGSKAATTPTAKQSASIPKRPRSAARPVNDAASFGAHEPESAQVIFNQRSHPERRHRPDLHARARVAPATVEGRLGLRDHYGAYAAQSLDDLSYALDPAVRARAALRHDE